MSLIPNVGRKSFSIRVFIIFIYTSLILMGATMIIPFLITLTSSTTNNFDYERFWPVPRYCWSRNDRFMKGIVYFFNGYRGWNAQMRAVMPEAPKHWTSWNTMGRDLQNVDKIAGKYLNPTEAQKKQWDLMAMDYSEFSDSSSLTDTRVTVINPQSVNFMTGYYLKRFEVEHPVEAKKMSASAKRTAALKLLNTSWGLPFESFFNVNFKSELNAPMAFQGWFSPNKNDKFQDFLRLKEAYRAQLFTPGVGRQWFNYLAKHNYKYENAEMVFPVMADSPEELRSLWSKFKAKYAPASPTIPYALRTAWYKFLRSEEVADLLKLDPAQQFDIDIYNEIAGTNYSDIRETPFPVPASVTPKLKGIWEYYVRTAFPLRLTTIKNMPDKQVKFQEFIQKEIKHLRIANELLATNHKSWSDFVFTAQPPAGLSNIEKNRRGIWKNFVKQLPMEDRQITCSEIQFQEFLLKKYKTLDSVNKAYGWNLKHIEEAFPPFMQAYLKTFENNEWALTLYPIFGNYKVIFEYLFINANAVPVTLLLIVMTIFFTLTVNPIAAYSMSRFNLRGQDKVILFMLATMAFPAMVSAIPGYLLMRDLGLLNTFFALVLPGAANGMAIFILKGFFDSLPQELFEAATIDGASEFQIFRIIAMPMVKPILAINCLTAFILAYNGWQWALIICQDKSMWTIAVWLYQASMWWSSMPWVVSAGFVIASVPTFLVFISCQKIILRGIIIPSMK
jgi:ABC-type glycerol-3-phosphate transport system permease component